MPRYYFDVQAGERSVRDVAGMDLSDDLQAIREANLILEQLAEDALARCQAGMLSVDIYSETGVGLYQTSSFSLDI